MYGCSVVWHGVVWCNVMWCGVVLGVALRFTLSVCESTIMYVCMYICTYVHMYVHTWVRMYLEYQMADSTGGTYVVHARKLAMRHQAPQMNAAHFLTQLLLAPQKVDRVNMRM